LKKWIRKRNGDHIKISISISKDWYTFSYAPRYTHYCIMLGGWKMKVIAFYNLDVFWLCILFVYNLVTWLLRWCNCPSCVRYLPITCTYDHVQKNQKYFSLFLKYFVGVYFTNPHRDLTHPLGEPIGLKGLLILLNVTIIPMKLVKL